MRARLAATVLVLAGCGGPGPSPVPSGPPVSDLRVGLQEFRLQLSAGAVRPGPVTVTVTNAGSAAHDLRVRAGDRVLGQTELLQPGGRQVLTLQVAPGGTLRLDCTVAGHATQGMRARLAVRA